jgi:GlpG protein
MRAIGHLPDESSARSFGDFLLVQAIRNTVEPDDLGQWTVWVHEDDQLAAAQTLLAEFQRQPGDPKYRKAGGAARQMLEEEQRGEKAWRKRFHERQSLWRGGEVRPGRLTIALTVVCVALAAAEPLLGGDPSIYRHLYISEYARGLPELLRGEVWRLFTPILLHQGILHLAFNMLWLLDLGSLVESRSGTPRLALLVGVIAGLSNLGQYLMSGPAFGGMSGVIYGLLGYVWLRGRLDPRSRLFVDPTTLAVMMVWFFVCLTGLLGPVANMAHAVGLGAGLACGFVAARLNA